jgi:hyperosmotically inducible periplasmic protein
MASVRKIAVGPCAALLGALALCGCTALSSRPPTSGYVVDSAITARVRAALVQDAALEASEVGVYTYNGLVTLNGVVDDQLMVRRAILVAERTPGVRSVRNAMQVAAATPELTAR